MKHLSSRKARRLLLAAGAIGLFLTTATALAGSGVGDVFNLGQTNTVGATSTLSGETAAPQLTLKNTSVNTSATALNLVVGAGRTPFKVNSAVKVANLNADLLDGIDSKGFLAAGGKAADADKLDAHDSSYFLPAAGKAADADKLDGHDGRYFLPATGKAADADTLDGHDAGDFYLVGTSLPLSGSACTTYSHFPGTIVVSVDSSDVVALTCRRATLEELAVSTSGAGSVTSSPAGIDCGATCRASFTFGTVVTLTAHPDPATYITNWSGGCSVVDGNVCTVDIDGPKSVTATFVEPPTLVPLTITKSGSGSGTPTTDPGGINCGDTCTASFPPGTRVFIAANPAPGSAASAYTASAGSCLAARQGGLAGCLISSLTAPTSVDIAYRAGKILSVSSGEPGPIQVTSAPAGVDCVLTSTVTSGFCDAAFDPGTVVTLTASLATGLYWGGDCSGSTSEPCVVTLDADRNVVVTRTGASTNASDRALRPVPQDFHKAFGLGLDDKHIGTIGEGGVALAAIQGLYRQNQVLRRRNRAQDARLARFERQNRSLSARLSKLEQELAHRSRAHD